jgi:putative endopeptidase
MNLRVYSVLVCGMYWAAAVAQTSPGLSQRMDPSIKPGDDFYAYANGGWIKGTEIPADRGSTGALIQLNEITDMRIYDLIGKSPIVSGADPLSGKVLTYFSTFMDERRIESLRLRPLAPTLQHIAAINGRPALARFLGGTLRADVDVLNSTQFHTENLLGLWVAQDLDNPAKYSPFLLQGGLGMPDRDYYLSDSPHMAEIRARYQSYIASLLQLAGMKNADTRAAGVLALELRIAQIHASRADSESVLRGNNHWPRGSFESHAPGLNWGEYFRAAQLAQQKAFVVWQPDAIRGISALTASETLETWKDYLFFHAINHFASFLPRSVVDQQFAFYSETLAGTPQQRERWKRALAATNSALGEAVGHIYVAHYFPPASKQAIEGMVRELIAAFAQRIDALDWMSNETKQEAKAKLAALKIGIGYPDQLRDYSKLRVVKGDAFGNAQRAELFEYQRNLAKLGQAVDRQEWAMTPQMVNAVNLPAMNALNFPAAILQAPFFDPTRPSAMNYGAIGTIIGHEISHSFDDQGALFDAHGRLRNWWTQSDLAHFEASAQQLVLQFDSYRPFPDLAVNGKQTLSENIADLAGLAAAHDAYRLTQAGQSGPVVDGLNDEQQFYLSFGQNWGSKFREPALRARIISDGHAPGRYRAQTVRNIDGWYQAFDVNRGQHLFLAPEQRVRMW